MPERRSGESYPGERMEINGEVTAADNGCVFVAVDGDAVFAIWPSGSEGPDDSGSRLRLPNGESVREGDSIVGIGVLTPTEPLISDRNGYWANVIGYCDPNADAVLALEEAQLAPAGSPGA